MTTSAGAPAATAPPGEDVALWAAVRDGDAEACSSPRVSVRARLLAVAGNEAAAQQLRGQRTRRRGSGGGSFTDLFGHDAGEQVGRASRRLDGEVVGAEVDRHDADAVAVAV